VPNRGARKRLSCSVSAAGCADMTAAPNTVRWHLIERRWRTQPTRQRRATAGGGSPVQARILAIGGFPVTLGDRRLYLGYADSLIAGQGFQAEAGSLDEIFVGSAEGVVTRFAVDP